jgi:hypothetical protein
MFLVVVMVAGLLAWCACGPVLAAWMGRRGFDRGSWLILGVLFGPVALLIAAMDHFLWIPPQPWVVQPPKVGSGSLSVLAVDNGEHWEALPAFVRGGADVRRRMIVRVLPEGGPGLDVEKAASELRRRGDAAGQPSPGLAVLFGRPDDAVRRFAIDDGYDVVVHIGDDRKDARVCTRSALKYLSRGSSERGLSRARSRTVERAPRAGSATR